MCLKPSPVRPFVCLKVGLVSLLVCDGLTVRAVHTKVIVTGTDESAQRLTRWLGNTLKITHIPSWNRHQPLSLDCNVTCEGVPSLSSAVVGQWDKGYSCCWSRQILTLPSDSVFCIWRELRMLESCLSEQSVRRTVTFVSDRNCTCKISISHQTLSDYR